VKLRVLRHQRGNRRGDDERASQRQGADHHLALHHAANGGKV
jgi:hypothetical protein